MGLAQVPDEGCRQSKMLRRARRGSWNEEGPARGASRTDRFALEFGSLGEQGQEDRGQGLSWDEDLKTKLKRARGWQMWAKRLSLGRTK